MIKIIEKIRPQIKPYTFFIKTDNTASDDLLEIYSWIFTNIGPYNKSRVEFLTINPLNIAVYFKYRIDAMAFKLRWL